MTNNSRQAGAAYVDAAYGRWLEKAGGGRISDPDVVRELQEMEGDQEKITDAFYRELSFGTGGLRGILGAGPNRMNVHTVARASQGLADYVARLCMGREGIPYGSRDCGRDGHRGKGMGEPGGQAGGCSIAVSYDSRIKSLLFARTACQVFAANGIKAYLYRDLMPTPCLSFAVRRLGCAAGVMVTASHNPKEYNGYKVYGSDGCQITVEAAGEIYKAMEGLDMFDDIRIMDFQAGLESGGIEYISGDVYTEFIQAVKGQSVLGNVQVDKTLPMVYSPLNGTGLKPVLQVLRESGYANITVVKEQEEPDGNFPTCPYPNPEEEEALSLGLAYAKEKGAALVLATDPDCDRAGILVRDSQGRYVGLTGNETGVLLLDYICSRRTADGTMPERPVMAKTIVTTDMGERIASRYGVETVNVLTGFKFIGEQIGILEAQGREKDFIFAFEESYGYLGGPYVRDKDGVGAAFLICEMCGYYGARGMNLMDKLDELYRTYGFYVDRLHCYRFPGMEGAGKMDRIMEDLRRGPVVLGGMEAEKVIDYGLGINGLPKSNVLKFLLMEGCSAVVRPSGTEPKLKVYISARAGSREEAGRLEARIAADLQRLVTGN